MTEGRKEFETWAEQESVSLGLARDFRVPDEYQFDKTQLCFEAWQAGELRGIKLGLEAAAKLAEKSIGVIPMCDFNVALCALSPESVQKGQP